MSSILNMSLYLPSQSPFSRERGRLFIVGCIFQWLHSNNKLYSSFWASNSYYNHREGDAISATPTTGCIHPFGDRTSIFQVVSSSIGLIVVVEYIFYCISNFRCYSRSSLYIFLCGCSFKCNRSVLLTCVYYCCSPVYDHYL